MLCTRCNPGRGCIVSTLPGNDYWTDDLLRFSGTSTSCSVSLTAGTDCGANTPMRVCKPTGLDSFGNTCNWTNCGIGSPTPNWYFGGCTGNTTAGTVCVPVP
jgi:hypothetical protein